jgi:hypothetical protein
MYKTADNLLNILVAPDKSSVIFPPIAWSVVDIPEDVQETAKLFGNLYNSPTTKHVTLIVNRKRKKDRILADLNMHEVLKKWEYLDTTTISYDKPASSGSNRLLPISEVGHIFYKGQHPDIKATSWFNEEFSNSTTNWDLGVVNPAEGKKTYLGKFSWQLNLLMRSLSNPLEIRSFAYLCDFDKNDIDLIYKFCKTFSIGCYLVCRNGDEANNIIKQCNKISLTFKGLE